MWAAEQNVPADVIFHDSTLKEVAQRQPHTLDQLRGITGIGERKLARYGDTLLDALAQHVSGAPSIEAAEPPADKTSTVETSIGMFRQNGSVEEIAAARGLKPTTIYGHLALGDCRRRSFARRRD